MRTNHCVGVTNSGRRERERNNIVCTFGMLWERLPNGGIGMLMPVFGKLFENGKFGFYHTNKKKSPHQ